MPKVIAEGGRSNTIRRFRIASETGAEVALLVDSESRVDPGKNVAEHLTARGEWHSATNEPCLHLMVQVMESWLLTQPAILAEHFGKKFDEAALPGAKTVESVDKAAVYAARDKASRNCPSGPYTRNKMKGFEILEHLDSGPIESASAFANCFFDFLRAECKPA